MHGSSSATVSPETAALLQSVCGLFESQRFREAEAALLQAELRLDDTGGDPGTASETETLWLTKGLVALKRANYVAAKSCFDECLEQSRHLFAAGEHIPTYTCMEALKGRALCYLKGRDYQRATRDYKEWLQLQAIFHSNGDRLPVLYHLALCYKLSYRYDAAVFWYEKAMAEAKHAGIADKATFCRAQKASRLIAEIRAARTEEDLIEEILAVGEPAGSETVEESTGKALALRAKVQCFVATGARRTLKREQAAAEPAPARGGWREAVQRPGFARFRRRRRSDDAAAPKPPPAAGGAPALDGPRQKSLCAARRKQARARAKRAIVDVAASLLSRLLGGHEAQIRDYLGHGVKPETIHLVEACSIKPVFKQTLNFCAELSLNFSTMLVWKAVGEACHEAQMRLTTVTEYEPTLPFLCGPGCAGGSLSGQLSGQRTPECYAGATCFHTDDRMDHVDLSRSLSQGPIFTPRLFRLEDEEPLLLPTQQADLCKILPAKHAMHNWSLVFSTRRDGFNLRAFYKSMLDSGADETILLVQTTDLDVIGGYATQPLIPQRQPFGSGESFVFAWKEAAADCPPELCAWHWSGDNRLFAMCSNTGFSLGGGNTGAAISVDGNNFSRGTSERCQTFDSPQLTSERSFVVKCMECWSFADSHC
ncbi:Oxidation resistance protein 1 [Diplonema papillatum]|nr:Oxidation resistance protein 1 [Diplonema papillatum]